MHLDENNQHVNRVQTKSKLYYPIHLTLNFFGSLLPIRRLFYTESHTWNSNMGSSNGMPYLNSKHAIAKIGGLLFVMLAAAFSYFSYSDSPWYTQEFWKRCDLTKAARGNNMLVWTFEKWTFKMETTTCPSITQERFLVCVSLTVLIVSFINLVACCAADIDTVNIMRKRDAFYNLFCGIVLIIGGALFISSPARLATTNKCRVFDSVTANEVQAFSCNEYFFNSTKFIAGGLGIAVGFYYAGLACILENTKLYGMESVQQSHFRRSEETNDSMPPARQSIMRQRRSSVTSAARVKKGVGSFGAVTSNIGSKGHGSRKGGGSSDDVPSVTHSAPHSAHAL